jgi:hypothetical protein
MDASRGVTPFDAAGWRAGTVVFAEKGTSSTSHVSPTQQHYRSEDEWRTYRTRLARMLASNRPHLARSMDQIRYHSVVGGHHFIDRDFIARDPSTEIQKSRSAEVKASG